MTIPSGRRKPCPSVRPHRIIHDGKNGPERYWYGRCFLNELKGGGAAHIRWETIQNNGKHHHTNNTEIWIVDCEDSISLEFRHSTLKEFKYSIRKVDRLINELHRAKRAMYSAVKARGLNVDG